VRDRDLWLRRLKPARYSFERHAGALLVKDTYRVVADARSINTADPDDIAS
jgi:hypothetical protein